MKNLTCLTALSSLLLLNACGENTRSVHLNPSPPSTVIAEVTSMNPLLEKSTLQYQAPNFADIKDEHFMPAFEQGIKQHLTEALAIANNPAPATFENTLIALEKSAELLTRVSAVFYNLAATDSNAKRQEIESAMAPLLAQHDDNIYLDAKLFSRVKHLYTQRNDAKLDEESTRLIEVYYKRFVRAGAMLTAEQKVAIRALNEEQAKLSNAFSQNLMAETNNIAVIVDTKAELAGLPNAQITAAAAAATAIEQDGKYLISITNTTRQPILALLSNRELRQRIWQASANRNQTGATDNQPIVARLAQLRAERAQLLGYDNWASYSLEAQMAKTPKAVYDMLSSMVPAVVANVKKEAAAIQTVMQQTDLDTALQPWDWDFYAEKVRQAQYDLDENEVNQYFEFTRVLEDGVFYTFKRLFGINFTPRPDLPVYHPDVTAYEVFDADGSSLAIFYADYFARDSKQGGAWMNSFVDQSKLLTNKPVIVNVLNIPKAANGEATLVSYDNVTTMFHELGHGLHGIFSAVNYPSLSGTAVSNDFVEFPSTFEEDWAMQPEVIANYAKHYETGQPIPAALLEKVIKSRSFNQGFDTLEYLAAALLDMEWHTLPADAVLQEVNEFEASVMKKYGIDIAYVPPRYKSNFFSHSMDGGYSAAYYAYMWSEILAADAFAYMQQQGGLTRENGDNFRRNILAVGNSRPPMQSYQAFRGQAPSTDALLKRRGLTPTVNK